jgi:hypothetical protein
LNSLGNALESAQKVVRAAEGKLENTEVSTKYEITKRFICSKEHIEHELNILKDVSEVQRRSR